MGRRGSTKDHGEAKAAGSSLQCPSCKRRRPRSAFTRIELGSNGLGRCRDCCFSARCRGCQEWLSPEHFESTSSGIAWDFCKRCKMNTAVDKLLQTPKDEVTHFGPMRVLRLAREAEYALLLSLNRKGLYEEMLLRRIVAFLRVPFVTTQNGVHYCELCDHSFPEAPAAAGQRLKMTIASNSASWGGCPYPSARLQFLPGESHTAVEVCQGTDGSWFFKTQVKARGKQASEEHAGGVLPQFVALWAPVSATELGLRPSPQAQHLATEAHRGLEVPVLSGERLLLHRAALRLAKQLHERPGISLSRFVAGLGISERFCCPADVASAGKLERVRDVDVPLKFLREYFDGRPKDAWRPPGLASFLGGPGREILWLPPDQVMEAQDAYEQHGRRGAGRRGTGGARGKRCSGARPDDALPVRAAATQGAKGSRASGTDGDEAAPAAAVERVPRMEAAAARRRAQTGSSSDGAGYPAQRPGLPQAPPAVVHPLVASRERTASGTLIW